METTGHEKGIGCQCENFCHENIESFSAWELLQSCKTRPSDSLYYSLKNAALQLGVKEESFTRQMDYQIMTDFLISNTDRHLNNMAFLRDPDSLEILGLAPLYDSGNSMYYRLSYNGLSGVDVTEIETNSFLKREIRLLQYVRDRKAVDLTKAEPDFAVFEKDISERHIRIPKLKELYIRKLELLEQFQKGKDIWKTEIGRKKASYDI